MSQAFALCLAGFVQIFVGWLFFRLPGISWWGWHPVWRANQVLTPAGVALWVGGLVQMFVGTAAMALA